MSQLFLSYSSKDRDIGLQVKAALEAKGHSVWFDQDQIKGGDFYADRIPKGIREADIFLLLVTSNSVGDDRIQKQGSHEISREIGLAQDYKRKIIPLKADTTPAAAFNDEFEYQLRIYQWIDICAAIKLNNFTAEVDQIFQTSATISTVDLDTHYIKEIEVALKAQDPEQALIRIDAYHFLKADVNEIKFLKCTAHLLKCSMSKMSKSQADNFVSHFRALLDSEMAVPSAYILGIFSRFYYQANFIADPTGGFEQLKAYASSRGRLKAKYKLMAEHLLPSSNRYALEWQF